VLIYACVSAHGFGHGSRCAAVLGALARLRPEWRLVLSTALPTPFLDLAFADVPHQRRPCRWDVGVVQADALAVDEPATLAALERLAPGLDATIEQEADWLRRQRQPLLILADVPPDAARLAGRVDAPLLWLASFGWDAIYGPMGEAFAPWAERCLELYRQGDLLLGCPFALPMPWGLPRVELGITSSPPRHPASLVRQRLDLPRDRAACVLISFGGLGLSIDPALLDRWRDHCFVGTDPWLADLPNGRHLPAQLRPVDVMPVTGRLITKPGYSSFCEAMAHGVGIHLVRRAGFAEAPVLEEALQRHGRHRLLEEKAFRAGEWQLDQPLEEPIEGPLRLDGAQRAAAAIIEAAEQGISKSDR
jgi:hypothetical protein